MNTFGFIGCGNMGGILATCCAEIFHSNTLLCDHNADKVEKIASKTAAKQASVLEIAQSCRYIFLGVKPQALKELLLELKPILEKRTDRFVLVSMAAGVTLDTLQTYIGHYPLIRIMPNTPASVGEGVVLYCQNDLVTEEDITRFTLCLAKAGTVTSIEESRIDAASALSGCGPAFVYTFIDALADGAVKCGLPRDQALSFAAMTVAGAGKAVLLSGMHPGVLKDAVCSPGGSTIAGISALEEKAFRGAVITAVEASYQRTKELG